MTEESLQVEELEQEKELSIEEQKEKALRSALNTIKKKTKGQTALFKNFKYEELTRIPLPYLQVNHILGGGIPLGRLIEVYGLESSGKSLICAQIVAQFQRAGYRCCWMDMERAIDLEFYSDFGVDVDELILSQPETAEDCLDTINILVNSGAVNLIIVDSVASMPTKEQMGKTAEEKTMASLARILSTELPKLLSPCNDNKCTVVFINQVREKVGVMFGNPEDTPGGKALKFYSSIRMELRRQASSEKLDPVTKDPVGHKVNIKCVKNKTSPPGRKGEFTIFYDGREITKKDTLLEGFDIALKNELLQVDGRTYTFQVEDIKVVGSKDKFIQQLLDNEDLCKLFISELTRG